MTVDRFAVSVRPGRGTSWYWTVRDKVTGFVRQGRASSEAWARHDVARAKRLLEDES